MKQATEQDECKMPNCQIKTEFFVCLVIINMN